MAVKAQKVLRKPKKVTPARWVAWQALNRTFKDDAWTDRVFSELAVKHNLDQRERAFAQRLAYGSVQQAKRIDHVVAVLGKRPLRKLDPAVLNVLRVGGYELLVLSGAQREAEDGELIPGGSSAHAAVSQAVELVRAVVGERAVAFTNAILRRAQVDAANILAQLDSSKDEDLAVMISMPQWLVEKVRADHGQKGIDALEAQNHSTGITSFRVTSSVDLDVSDKVKLRDVPWPKATPNALLVERSTANLSEYIEQGVIVPQSLASQLVVSALNPQQGERVLDMCAAPGGKTTHIASLVGKQDSGSVLAVELHEHRSKSILKLAEKVGVADYVDVLIADATELELEQFANSFDRVLLDAPCSGTGVLSARPDSRWKRSVESVNELAQLQLKLLEHAAKLVKPSGIVVYSTCSILGEEDEQIVARCEEFGLIPDDMPSDIPKELCVNSWQVRTWPQDHKTEGFFIARMRRVDKVGA